MHHALFLVSFIVKKEHGIITVIKWKQAGMSLTAKSIQKIVKLLCLNSRQLKHLFYQHKKSRVFLFQRGYRQQHIHYICSFSTSKKTEESTHLVVIFFYLSSYEKRVEEIFYARCRFFSCPYQYLYRSIYGNKLISLSKNVFVKKTPQLPETRDSYKHASTHCLHSTSHLNLILVKKIIIIIMHLCL